MADRIAARAEVRRCPESQPVSDAEPLQPVRATVDAIYQSELRRVLATLIRLLGDFDLAEEALQDAFRAALAQWPRAGVPANPRAWLVSAGRFKAIDACAAAPASMPPWPSWPRSFGGEAPDPASARRR